MLHLRASNGQCITGSLAQTYPVCLSLLGALVFPTLETSVDRFILGLLGAACRNDCGLFDISGIGRSVGIRNVSPSLGGRPCLSLFLRLRPADRGSQLCIKAESARQAWG